MTNANSPLPYEDVIETIPADEADDIQRVVRALELILARTQAKSGQFRADVHVKAHGYAQGEFRVLPNLSAEFAQGLFGHDRVYPTVVRFSNASSKPQSDAIPDGRGMAIKCWGGRRHGFGGRAESVLYKNMVGAIRDGLPASCTKNKVVVPGALIALCSCCRCG